MFNKKEQKLLKKVREGNERAFKQLYEQYASYALRTAYAITKNTSDASDVVQETFIRVYRSLHTFDLEKAFRPWFYQILLNESRRLLDKRKKQAIPVASEEVLDVIEARDDTGLSNEELLGALDYLADDDRTLVILKYVDRFTEQELAQMMELNVNTIKSRLYRARNRLKEVFTGGELDG